MSTGRETDSWRPPRPVCGRLSLWALAAAAAVVVLPILITGMGLEEFLGLAWSGMALLIIGLYGAGIMSIASFFVGVIGLVRRESPRWLAASGLA